MNRMVMEAWSQYTWRPMTTQNSISNIGLQISIKGEHNFMATTLGHTVKWAYCVLFIKAILV